MTSRIDVIGQNGNDGLAYLADVGGEQQHVSSSQTEIDHIAKVRKMVTGQTLPPDGAQYWHGGNGLHPQGWYRLDTDGWMFHDRHGSAWIQTEPPPSHEMQRIIPGVDHIGDTTEKVGGQKFDQGKPMMSLIPPLAEMAVAEVLTFGANKYGPDNWRHVEDLERRYIDAAMRHINAYRAGFERDFESDRHHLAHAICCLMFVAEIDLEDGEK